MHMALSLSSEDGEVFIDLLLLTYLLFLRCSPHLVIHITNKCFLRSSSDTHLMY